MSANWMKLSLGCERRARLVFRQEEHSGTFKSRELEVCVSAQKRATDQRAKRRTPSPQRERARCQEQEAGPGQGEEWEEAAPEHADHGLVEGPRARHPTPGAVAQDPLFS